MIDLVVLSVVKMSIKSPNQSKKLIKIWLTNLWKITCSSYWWKKIRAKLVRVHLRRIVMCLLIANSQLEVVNQSLGRKEEKVLPGRESLDKLARLFSWISSRNLKVFRFRIKKVRQTSSCRSKRKILGIKKRSGKGTKVRKINGKVQKKKKIIALYRNLIGHKLVSSEIARNF